MLVFELDQSHTVSYSPDKSGKECWIIGVVEC